MRLGLPKPEWTEKVWGRTRCIMATAAFEVHELEALEGGYSSRHRHRKLNRFHVMEGLVRVEMAGAGAAPVEEPEWVELRAGDFLEVAPMVWHRFRIEEDAHIIEVYYHPSVDPLDIERHDVGGMESEPGEDGPGADEPEIKVVPSPESKEEHEL